ncbi:FAD-dependent oxidoreductase [Francisella tularensis]|uniref:FAD-dependent oxidoreductase n=1 Tax=Francisella tularensis TaxID=263 RepID=UPI0034A0C904
MPKAVLHINTEEEVLKVIELANTYKVPLTFRAAGTSLNGQGITDHVLVVITNKWNNYSIENDREIIRLQPSLTGGQANLFLNKYGRKIGPDPSSVNVAKIGGIVANNASGMCCGFKHNSYNTLQDIRVIFSDGQVLDTKSVDSREKFAIISGVSGNDLLLEELSKLTHCHKFETYLRVFIDLDELLDTYNKLFLHNQPDIIIATSLDVFKSLNRIFEKITTPKAATITITSLKMLKFVNQQGFKNTLKLEKLDNSYICQRILEFTEAKDVSRKKHPATK